MKRESFIEKTMPTDGRCTLDQYLKGDEDLSVCMELDDETWETDFLQQLGREYREVTAEE